MSLCLNNDCCIVSGSKELRFVLCLYNSKECGGVVIITFIVTITLFYFDNRSSFRISQYDVSLNFIEKKNGNFIRISEYDLFDLCFFFCNISLSPKTLRWLTPTLLEFSVPYHWWTFFHFNLKLIYYTTSWGHIP